MTDDASPEVVVTYPFFDQSDPRTAGALTGAGLTARHAPRLEERSPADVVALMAGAIAGVVSTDPFDRSVFERCPRLRVLARVGVGLDSIDLDAATEAGVSVTTTPGINTNTVAEHTLALVLACTRRIVSNHVSLGSGAWDRGGSLIGTDLAGSTVGIVGLGAIGRAVAARLAGFEVRLLGYDTRAATPAGVRRVGLDELLSQSDIVTLHVPLAADTRHLIGADELASMRRGSILINASRGGIVDEDALLRSLEDGYLGGAALDVFAHEPPFGSRLFDLPQVVVTPHIGGISVATQQAALEMAVGSVLDVLAGRRPPGLVNPETLPVPAAAADRASEGAPPAL